MGSILRLLAAALLITLPAGAAAAAPPAPTLEAYVGGLTLAPGGPEKSTLLWLRTADVTLSEHRFEVTVDYSEVADFAEVGLDLEVSPAITALGALDGSDETEGPCELGIDRYTCVWDETIYRPDTVPAVGFLEASPLDGAEVGNEGTIRIRTRIDGGAPAETRSTVRVGVPVDVAAVDDEVSVAAGGTASATPMVRNLDETEVNGVVMYVSADSRLLAESSYSNCMYGDGRMACTFDDVLAPESSRRLAEPLLLHPPDGSVPGSEAHVFVQWMTMAEWEDFVPALPDGFLGDEGDGDPLELAEMDAEGQAVPEADRDSRNDTGTITVTVTGGDAPDFAAIGARVVPDESGSATIQVGIRNVGPGTLHPDLYPNNQVLARVVPPPAVDILRVDERCARSDVIFVCYATETMGPGDEQTFAFVVRPQAGADRRGQVEVNDTLAGQAGGQAVNPRNNTDDIVVSASGRGGGGGAPGVGLPVTGSQAAGTAAVGLAMIGVGVLLTVRRSRRPVCAHAMTGTRRGRHRKGTAR